MNRYAKVLTASALAYTAEVSATAKWSKGIITSSSPQFVATTELVTTTEQLVALTQEPGARHLVVRGNLADVPSFRLAPGQTLTGDGDNASISFVRGADGLQLTTNNEVRSLRLEASSDHRAIFNDTSVERLGRVRLTRITAVGQVQLLARDALCSGHVEVDGLDIVAADTRARSDRPHGFGVKVVQGAFTLWNMQTDERIGISARLKGLSIGRESAPVFGSGILLSGAGFNGGRLLARLLETESVYSHGQIAPGTSDVITGGVFVAYGAVVDLVRNRGPVVTYGVNDMVLDNWGAVDHWIAEDKLTSYGSSSIGFVNFGSLNELWVNAPIETFGKGARGFNIYGGTLNNATFDRITTHADGAAGVQISTPIGRLVVRRGIETFGGIGESLLKGEVAALSAIGVSMTPGGAARAIEVDGGVTTNGHGTAPIELHGSIDLLRINGGARASGGGFGQTDGTRLAERQRQVLSR
jgi:hypothetical protein